jgi:hypothetical protein
VKEAPRQSAFEGITELVFQTIFGVWWLAGLHYQYLVLGSGQRFADSRRCGSGFIQSLPQ